MSVEQKNGRRDDMTFKAFGLEIHASGRSVIFIILAIGAIGLLYWHDYKSDNWARVFHEGQWVQMLILATPEKDRQRVLRGISRSAEVPASVKQKINETQTDSGNGH